MMRPSFATMISLMLFASSARAGDEGLTGYWKFSIAERGMPNAFWLLHMETKDGKLTANVEPLRGAPKVKVGEVKLVGDTFTIKLVASGPMGSQISLDYQGSLPKPGAKKIYGSLDVGDEVVPVLLESTTAKSVFELDQETLTRFPSDPRALVAIFDVIDRAKDNKVAAKDLQSWVDGSLKTGEIYGPRYQLMHQMRLLDALRRQKSYMPVAIETAKKISGQIDPKGPLDAQLQLLSTVEGVLRAGDLKEEANALEARIEKLEGQAYAEYAKTSIPFNAPKFDGRKAKSNRAVVVELFTGAQCPPCVAADVGFDALGRSYPRTDVVLLQYHMPIPPGPEPMFNADGDARWDFYAETYPKNLRGTPAILFNGRPDAPGGGPREEAVEKYKEYSEVVNKLLELPAKVRMTADAVRKGEKIDITATAVHDEKAGIKLRLRFVLVEDWVRYKGGNQLPYHHRVVRAMPGGARGIAIDVKNFETSASVDLVELRKKLDKFLDENNPEGPRPMRFRNLHVVALVQNDDTTEILHAVDVMVTDKK